MSWINGSPQLWSKIYFRTIETKRQKKNRSFFLHFLTELGPCKGSFAFFSLEQFGNLPLRPESLQFRDILTKTHLCIFTKRLESLRKTPTPAASTPKSSPSVPLHQQKINIIKNFYFQLSLSGPHTNSHSKIFKFTNNNKNFPPNLKL